MALHTMLALPLLFSTALIAPMPAQAAEAVVERGLASGDRTITQVVKLLQRLLDKSKADGDAERDLYAKYKCYCDTNEASKKAEIEELAHIIGVLESKIEELLASSGILSKEVAQLDSDMTANQASQQKATAIRNQEHQAYLAEVADLTGAISQLAQAIDALSQIGADQTLNTARDHTQYMAGFAASLANLKTSVKQALLAASAVVSKKQARSVDTFLQAPFTGTYTAQAGEVVGILKDMRDTFTANLAAANLTEATALAAYNSYMQIMVDAYNKMQASFNEKQGILSSNDADLAVKKQQLSDAKAQKAEDEDFVAKLLDICAAKKKQYNQRVVLRLNEQVALSEAISILNSDAAFATFGTANATLQGSTSFFQKRAIHRHRQSNLPQTNLVASPRQKAQAFLQKAAGHNSSPLLNRIIALLQANNPFTVVLNEIDKMIAIIGAEDKADADQKQWCDAERAATTASITEKAGQITTLTS